MPLTREFKVTVQARLQADRKYRRSFCEKASSACWLEISTPEGDLFSRKIVGWAARPPIHREFVLDAVLMAVRARRPRGALIHSDQGTQYGSDAWRRFCRTTASSPA